MKNSITRQFQSKYQPCSHNSSHHLQKLIKNVAFQWEKSNISAK